MSTQTQLDPDASSARLSNRSCAQTVLLPGDDPAEYHALLAELTAHFSPEDLTEDRFVREMVDAEWRLRRIRQALESALNRRIADLTALHPAVPPLHLQSLAIETLAETGTSYGTWLRYESKFERQYERASRGWTAYQNARRSVSAKEADIWMKKAIFTPLRPTSPPETAPVAGQNAATQLRKLPSAQDATRASVVRDQKMGSNVQIPATPRTAPPVLTLPMSEAA